ncbi:MAG: hypothetical protein EXS22_08640 [Pedosphaera sp.]|nr:hypothetical protein [Pedosphaera sp.]MSU44089.1 hypothetical protein [Pedosphaera sp.]
MIEQVAFYILSAVAVLGALLAVSRRNLVHGVFALLLFFAALSGLFVMLLADYVAAVQVLVYIGAVGILLLFTIMLTEHVTGDDLRRLGVRGWFWGLLLAVAVPAVLILPAVLNEKSAKAAPIVVAQGNPALANNATQANTVKALGKVLMEKYVVPLEVLALLLTAALIGAVAVAHAPEKDASGKDTPA